MAARSHSDNDLFLSDVHLEERRPDSGEALGSNGDLLKARFPFHLPWDREEEEEEREWKEGSSGSNLEESYECLVVTRKANRVNEVLFLEHRMATPLSMVGLQLWRGALYLSDFIIDNRHRFQNAIVLEFGAGIGLASIVAGMFAQKVYATDIHQHGILELCQRNIAQNSPLLKGDVQVRGLDWCQPSPTTTGNGQFDWSVEDLKILSNIDLIIAADVVYDDELTSAFLLCLRTLLCQQATEKDVGVFVALERRINFTLDDLDAVSPSYDHFVSCVTERSVQYGLKGVCVDTPIITQYFQYERVPQLVLWTLSLMK